jgi:hypothetical protein
MIPWVYWPFIELVFDLTGQSNWSNYKFPAAVSISFFLKIFALSPTCDRYITTFLSLYSILLWSVYQHTYKALISITLTLTSNQPIINSDRHHHCRGQNVVFISVIIDYFASLLMTACWCYHWFAELSSAYRQFTLFIHRNRPLHPTRTIYPKQDGLDV